MTEDPELVALSQVCSALSGLDTKSQQRVIDYVVQRLGLAVSPANHGSYGKSLPLRAETPKPGNQGPQIEFPDDTDGVSPVAKKWMQRNDFTVDQLGHLFSLGTDEIDLVAREIPGTSKRERTRNVTILKGIAAYLSTGTARITAEQIKEACLHYGAFDSPNHAKYLRGMSTELSGSKEAAYTLTARGLKAGSELICGVLGMAT